MQPLVKQLCCNLILVVSMSVSKTRKAIILSFLPGIQVLSQNF